MIFSDFSDYFSDDLVTTLVTNIIKVLVTVATVEFQHANSIIIAAISYRVPYYLPSISLLVPYAFPTTKSG